MRVCLCILSTSCLFSLTVFGQEPPVDSSAAASPLTASLRIEANIDSAVVLMDSSWVGITPLTIDTVAPGWHTLHIIQPDLENWLTVARPDSVFLQPGDQRTLRYELQPRYMISTHPFGAQVLIGDSVVGTTPLVIKSNEELENRSVTVRKPGYEDETISLNSRSRWVVALDLKKEWQKGDFEEPIFKDQNGNGSDNLKLYITGAATILSGATAAYFKIKADNNYDRYQRTGDPAILRETRRLDAASAIALAATQVGLGLFTYFILSE